MTLRHLATSTCALALLGTGATLLLAQSPGEPVHAVPARPDRAKVRAEIIKLRAEVEMVQFDFDLARNSLLEDIKLDKSLELMGGMMQFAGAIQGAIDQAGKSTPPDEPSPKKPKKDPKKKTEEAKKAEQEEKKQQAEAATSVADRKKELSRLATALSEKRLDLEDAERVYRDSFR